VKSPTLPQPLSVPTLANGHVNGNDHLPNFHSNDTDGLANGHTNGVSISTNGNLNGTDLLSTHKSNGTFDYIPSRGLSDRGNAIQSRLRMFLWSSSDENGLKRFASTYKGYLHSLEQPEDEGAFLDDLAYTLAFKRSSFPWKASITARSISELLGRLENGLRNPVRSAAAPKLGFVFTGQGAQWHAMGRELVSYPVYKDALASADKYLLSLGCKWSLIGKPLGSILCPCPLLHWSGFNVTVPLFEIFSNNPQPNSRKTPLCPTSIVPLSVSRSVRSCKWPWSTFCVVLGFNQQL
jgi:hypothetical protein